MAGGHRSAVHPALVVVMTIHDIELLDDDFLTADQVGSVLHSSAQSIRSVANERGERGTGYHITWASDHSVQIPRIGFLNWYYGTQYAEASWAEIRKAAAAVTEVAALLNGLLRVLSTQEVRSYGQDRQSDD